MSARKRAPSKTASDVAAGSEIVVVGMANHVMDTGDGVIESLHAPTRIGIACAPVDEDGGLSVVGNGKIPVPGIDWEGVVEGVDPVPFRLELFGLVTIEAELDEVHEVELKLELLPLVLIEPC